MNIVEAVVTETERKVWWKALVGDWKSPKNWSLFIGRFFLGFMFLWSGIGKTNAWAQGRMATSGFLSGSSVASSPLAGFFNSLSGNWTVEYLVVGGEIAIGIALIVGLFLRVGAVSGALMMALFTAAMWPIADTAGANPLVDYRVIYMVMFGMFMFVGAGRFLGVDGLIENYLPKKLAKLKLLLG